jgi:hypothetical protein
MQSQKEREFDPKMSGAKDSEGKRGSKTYSHVLHFNVEFAGLGITS